MSPLIPSSAPLLPENNTLLATLAATVVPTVPSAAPCHRGTASSSVHTLDAANTTGMLAGADVIQWTTGGVALLVVGLVAYAIVVVAFVRFMIGTRRADAPDDAQTGALASAPAPESKGGTTELTIAIEGMACAACVSAVEVAVRGVPGVQHANVSLASQACQVAFDSGLTDTATIVATIKASGFAARVIRGSAVAQSAFSADLAEAHQWQWQCVLARGRRTHAGGPHGGGDETPRVS